MKHMLRLASIVVGIGLLAFTSTSCSSDYDATPEVPGKDTIKNSLRGEFTAIIDGVPFTATNKSYSDQTFEETRSLSLVGQYFTAASGGEDGQVITLNIMNYTGPASYVIDWTTNGTYTGISEGQPNTYLSKSGDSLSHITITSDGDQIEGSFYFIAAPNGSGNADNHVISNGSFSMPR